MEFSELAEERYSVRAYRPDPVEGEKLERVLGAARMAPTAGNRQPYQPIVIDTEGREEELLSIYNKPWFIEPPLVVCACGLPDQAATRDDGKSSVDIDVAIVLDHLVLAATGEGLGTCWVGAFDRSAAREVLSLPDEVEPIMFTPLGYPADERVPKRRKPIEELVRYERW